MKTLIKILNFCSALVAVSLVLVLVAELVGGLNLKNPDLFAMMHLGFFYYICGDVVIRLFGPNRGHYLVKHPTDLLAVFPFVSGFFGLEGAELLFWEQVVLVGLLAGRLSHLKYFFGRKSIRPPQMLLFFFIGISFVGSLVLELPISLQAGQVISYLDALFMATSAVCVTGLTTEVLAETFSMFGQIVLLIIIQIGGLGILGFSAILALFLTRRVSAHDRQAIQESYATLNSKELMSAIYSIFIYTFLFELVGTGALMVLWASSYESIGMLFYHALFHSVSSFCNAGFSLFVNGFEGFASQPGTLLVSAGLILLGGLGFPAIFNIRNRFFNRKDHFQLKLQTRMILVTTLALLLVGTGLILVLEYHRALGHLVGIDKWVNAFYLSVSSRTAGFHSFDLTQLSMVSVLVLCVLMFIGASPGSTGGGIKTTTFGVLCATIIQSIRGKNHIFVFNRKLPTYNIFNAVTIFFLSVLVVLGFFSVLVSIETVPLKALIFEVISAFGTVGLSLGITGDFSSVGKFVIILLMFVGRVGALTFAFALTQPKKTYQYTLPEERVLIV